MKRSGHRLACVFALLAYSSLLLVGLTSCALQASVPASVSNPPLYPAAEDVRTQERAKGSKIITYKVRENPDTVYKFYDDTLRRDEWYKPVSRTIDNGILYEWIEPTINGPGPNGYRLAVTATPIASGETQVQLDLTWFDPR